MIDKDYKNRVCVFGIKNYKNDTNVVKVGKIKLGVKVGKIKLLRMYCIKFDLEHFTPSHP